MVGRIFGRVVGRIFGRVVGRIFGRVVGRIFGMVVGKTSSDCKAYVCNVPMSYVAVFLKTAENFIVELAMT